MRGMIWALACWPGMLAAQEWVRADEAAIRAALGDRTVRFDAYTVQHFGADGETEFVTERAANGRWTVQDGQYCSQWPPTERLECYDVDLAGDRIRFIYHTGAVSEGVFAR